MRDNKIISISGKAIPIRGDNIDTDRIIPARYLMCVTFKELGKHAFEDDRVQPRSGRSPHPFDQPVFSQAQVLLVNKNFGCGSSREHAPQALARWNQGIRAIVGESFAEIFFGNCTTLGIPCVTADRETIDKLMNACETNPDLDFHLDLANMRVQFGAQTVSVAMPKEARIRLIEGRWDPTSELLKAKREIAATAATLPYFNGWT
jgi:3-isopropylmalate/(R)-2-methylmalate dehydratase small subunit